jgi:group I intron endonuclease
MQKLHYVYLTTNLINGKQYVGDHTINPKEKRYYIGSGLINELAIKKYGEKNFFKEILEWFDTRNESFIAEEKYIKQFNTLVPNGYNISPTGGMGVNGGLHSQESKDKVSHKNKGKNPWNKGINYTKEYIDKFCKGKHNQKGNKNSMFGKHHKEESRNKLRNATKNVPKVECEHCNKMIAPWIYSRYHGKQCKKNLTKV